MSEATFDPPQFYTGYFDRDLGGCDIGSITLGMNDTVEIFDNGKAGSGKSDLLCWLLSALVVFSTIGWILTCVLCQRKK